MLIPPGKYAEASRRFVLAGCFVIITMAGIGACIALYVGWPVADVVRNQVGGSFGSILAILSFIPFLVLPFLLPIPVLNLLDRRLGIPCPNCNVSLNSRCFSEQVLITRKCPHCGARVLSREEYNPPRPKQNPWRIIPLTIIFAVVIAMLIKQEGKQLLLDIDWFDTACFTVLGLVLGWRRSVMRRRWKQEAAEEESRGET